MSLLTLSNDLIEIENMIENAPSELIADQQSALIEQIKNKTDNFVEYSKHLEDQIEMAKKKINEIKEFILVRENALSRMEEMANMALSKLEVGHIDGNIYTISKMKGRKSVEIIDENQIPFECLEVKTVVNKTKVKELVESGIEVTGAKIVIGSGSIQFKTKPLSRKKDAQ